MIEAVYASVLGLLIPVLAVSVGRRAWRQARANARGRRTAGLSTGFFLQLAVFVLACFAFRHLSSSLKVEPEFFDPFQILQIPTSANSSVIRSQYHLLSKQFHPDKNPGDRNASQRFRKIVLAYKALSDPQARRNWKTYGHPDGYQPWKFDIAVPEWFRPGKDCGKMVLTLYVVGYLVMVVGFMFLAKITLDLLDPDKRSSLKITQEDVQSLIDSLDETSAVEDVLECLAVCPQLCSEGRRAVAVEMCPIASRVHDRLMSLKVTPLYKGPEQEASGQGKTSGGKVMVGTKLNSLKKQKKGSTGEANLRDVGDAGGASGDGEELMQESGGEKEVMKEFFSHGRRGEGHRHQLRSPPGISEGRPDISGVVKHNLVVLLSALWRTKLIKADGDSQERGPTPGPGQEEGRGGDGKGEAEGIAVKSRDEGVGQSEKRKGQGLVEGSCVSDSDLSALAAEQELILGLAEPLLEVCMQLAARKGSPRLLSTVVEAKAMLRRRLWAGGDDPEAMEQQTKELEFELDAAVPELEVKVKVETLGESQIAVGDTVTAIVAIKRKHAKYYQGLRKRRPLEGFLQRGEPWWVMVADDEGDKLVGVSPLLVEDLASDSAECQVT
ncbi:unnamed protein product [Discosporangium mesarthrocarpum]